MMTLTHHHRQDLNYNFRTEGFCEIASALTPAALGGRGLDWLELDTTSPAALRRVRDRDVHGVSPRKQVGLFCSKLEPFT